MKRKNAIICAAAGVLVLSSAQPAGASTTMPAMAPTAPSSTATGWNWRFDLYGWVQGLEGDMMIRGNPVAIDLGFDDILDNLDLALTAAGEVSYGCWSFQLDFSYAEVSSAKAAEVGRNRFAYNRLAINQFIGHAIMAYSVFEDPVSRLQVYGGVRVNSLDVDLDIITANLPVLGASGSETWIDPIIGVRYARDLSDRFFVRMVGDIGGVGIESDFTWQAMAMVGYRFNGCSSLLLGYRGIGTDFSDGLLTYDVVNHGPVLGFEFRF